MDLKTGFSIDDPPVTLRWGADESEVRDLLGSRLRQVTSRYWTTPITALGGLRCSVGLHFRGTRAVLQELEFFGNSGAEPQASFDEFQRHFEGAFGKPRRTRRGTAGFPDHAWLIGSIEIVHFVFDRFGPEEHMRVRRLDFSQRLQRWLGG